MAEQMATTVAAADAQQITLPTQLGDWREFAGTLDGYKIAAELGFDLGQWSKNQEQQYEETQRWDLNVLELRLVLFYEFRADYFTGYTYHERDDLVDSLLCALSRKTGLPYGQEGQ
jgi:hypothetical protein